jgi:uncharacterized protein
VSDAREASATTPAGENPPRGRRSEQSGTVTEHRHTVAPLLRDAASAAFFDAAAEGTLLLKFSPSSGHWSAPTATACELTQAPDLEWRPATGRGALVSWTVIPAQPPTVVGIVELDEGPWLTVQLVDDAERRVRAGATVTIEFVRPEGGEAVPVGVLDEDHVRSE